MKHIKENEQFEMGGSIFTYVMEGTSIKLKTHGLVGNGKIKPSFIPPSKKEVGEYFESKGYIRAIGEKAWEYYNAGEWHNSQGKPIRNWRQTCVANWMRDEHKIKSDTNVVDNFFQK